jgi:hypothetical protein
MPRKTRKQKRERRLHQEPIVRRVAEILSRGEPTRWRWSSAVHRGLRATLCLKGWHWEKADKHAASVVRLAALRIGLQVPSWQVAQGDAPQEITYHYCAGCRGHMPEGSDRPWCSPECNKLAYKRRFSAGGGYDDAAQRSAIADVLGGAEPRVAAPRWRCAHCGDEFEPDRSRRAGERRQRYCSKRCQSQSKRLAYRECLACATPFQARTCGRPQRCCSLTCQKAWYARQRQAKRRRPERPCAHCGAMYEPPTAPGRVPLWCSTACHTASSHPARVETMRRYREKKCRLAA